MNMIRSTNILTAAIICTALSCAAQTAPPERTSTTRIITLDNTTTYEVVAVSSFIAADTQYGEPGKVLIQGQTKKPSNHIGFRLYNPYVKTILLLDPATAQAAPANLHEAWLRASQYLKDNKLDAEWNVYETDYIGGHCWRAGGWQSCLSAQENEPVSWGFRLYRKNAGGKFEVFKPEPITVDTSLDPLKVKEEDVIMHLFIQVQPEETES